MDADITYPAAARGKCNTSPKASACCTPRCKHAFTLVSANMHAQLARSLRVPQRASALVPRYMSDFAFELVWMVLEGKYRDLPTMHRAIPNTDLSIATQA